MLHSVTRYSHMCYFYFWNIILMAEVFCRCQNSGFGFGVRWSS